jgi:hypothetical protein
MSEFLSRLQTETFGDGDWSMLAPGVWEHTGWLTPNMLRGELASALFDPKSVIFRRPDDMSDSDFAIEIAMRDSPFVVLTGPQGEFLELYDRRRIFEHIMRSKIGSIRSAGE